jgi:hypothetical protein
MNIEQVRERFKGAYVASYEKAQKRAFDGKYMSDRNDEDIPLVCQELNVLTVEDYDKWYGLYYLMEDPDTKEVMLVKLCWGDILEGIDHEFYPDSMVNFCIENGIEIDPVSYICICKSLLLYNNDLIDNHLPKSTMLLFVLANTNSISNTFYVNSKYDSIIKYSIATHVIEPDLNVKLKAKPHIIEKPQLIAGIKTIY